MYVDKEQLGLVGDVVHQEFLNQAPTYAAIVVHYKYTCELIYIKVLLILMHDEAHEMLRTY